MERNIRPRFQETAALALVPLVRSRHKNVGRAASRRGHGGQDGRSLAIRGVGHRALVEHRRGVVLITQTQLAAIALKQLAQYPLVLPEADTQRDDERQYPAVGFDEV